MLSKLQKLRGSREDGFTLIELLVVIIIIGVLAAIALPIFLNQQQEAIKASVKSDTRSIHVAVRTMLVKYPTADDATSATPLFEPITRSGGLKFTGDNYAVIVGDQTWGMLNGSKRLVSYQGTPNYRNYTILAFNNDLKNGWGYAFESQTGKFSEFIQF